MRYTDLTEAAVNTSLFDQIKASLPERDGEAYFQVSKNAIGNIVVSWDITFRRNTATGAFSDYGQSVRRANDRLAQLASQHKDSVVSLKPLTLDAAKRQDQHAEENGESAYSEYEQSFGGSLVLKSGEKRAKSKDGRKEHLDIAERLEKFDGKKVGKNLTFSVSRDEMSVTISWTLKFSGMRNREAIQKFSQEIQKAEEQMQKVLVKYNDQAAEVRRYNERESIELDRYMYPHEVKNEHTIKSTMSFLLVLPTQENGYGYYQKLNQERKAQLVGQVAK